MDPSLFERDQTSTVGLVSWGGGVVVHASPRRFVDVEAGVASVLTVPSCAKVLGVATFAGRPVVLCERIDHRVSVCERDGSATRLLPTSFDGHRPFVIAADATTLVVWEPSHVHVADAAGGWRTVPTTVPSAPTTRGGPKHAQLAGGELWLGYGAGEWGGAVVAVNLATGASRLELEGEPVGGGLPVTGMATDAQGALWVARGLSHLGMNAGTLERRDGGAWTLVARSPGAFGPGKGLPTAGWNLAATSFDGLALDAAGEPWMVTGSLGLVRRSSVGSFEVLTPGWPSFAYVTGVALRGTVAIIATFDAGVLLFDTKTRVTRRVTLGPGR